MEAALFCPLVLLTALFALALPAAADHCPPGGSVTITGPPNGSQNMSSNVRVDFTLSSISGGYEWTTTRVRVYDDDTDAILQEVVGTNTGGNNYCAVVNTNILANGRYRFYAFGVFTGPGVTYGHDQCFSPAVFFTTGNPSPTETSTGENLKCRCHCKEETGSSTDPRSGHQSFSIPVTSWVNRGATFDFSVSYDSHALKNPQAVVATPEFAGLSQRNSHWRHTFAQWIDLWKEPGGQQYAVWHHEGRKLAFPYNAVTGQYESPESNLTITADATPQTSPYYPCDGLRKTLTTLHKSFVIKDEEGTEFQFNVDPIPSGEFHLVWRTGECTAVPYYLLTRIKDRWGRELKLNWSNTTVTNGEPRVTTVKDEAGTTRLTLNYTTVAGFLQLQSVVDGYGRTHSFGFTAVPDEMGTNRQKLTSVSVQGPGSPNRIVRTWSFSYRDASDPHLAYGGSAASNGGNGAYTGDLVISKTEPDGAVTNYRYELVTLTGVEKLRLTEADWEGRVARIARVDASAPGGEWVTTRVKNSPTMATLTHPGGAAVEYSYTNGDLTGVRDVSTNRLWSYTFDGKHNLLSVRTPLEQAGVPLVEYQYTPANPTHIDQLLVKEREPTGGTLRDAALTLFDARNLPTETTVYGNPGAGRPHQITRFFYDENGPAEGNLTSIVEAFGTSEQQATTLRYDEAIGGVNDGDWGLPTSVTNEVGGKTSFDYWDGPGLTKTVSSPQNLAVPPTSADYASSVTTISYTSEHLPSQILDPLQHPVNITYNAAAPGSPELVITYTHQDGYSRYVRLDGMGRPKEAKDERWVLTQWAYNKLGQTVSVTRAVGTADQAVTSYLYDSRADLVAIDPPNAGSADVISFDYRRHNQNGTLEGTYEGQVCKITYADGTFECAGYNGAGELAWRRKPDGTIVTLVRDDLHRVKEVQYPASGGNPAFSVTTTFDEFGRVVSTSDLTGTTSVGYDSLNRTVGIAPPLPQKTLSFYYAPQTTEQRWFTSVNVAGVGTYEYREDSKGRLTEVVNPFGQSFRTEFDRDGKPRTIYFPNGMKEVRTYTSGSIHDSRDWLMKREVFRGDVAQSLLVSMTYSYATTGHMIAECDHLRGSHFYLFNNRYELIGESDAWLGNVLYTLDKNGNRLSKTTQHPTLGLFTDYYGVDAANKLLWVNQGTNAPPTPGQATPYTLYQHDLNGRVTQRDRRYVDMSGLRRTLDYSWDGADRLRSVKEGTNTRLTASYDGDGLRVSKWDYLTGQHDYSWGPGGVLFDSNQSTTHTPGFAQRRNGVDLYAHRDVQGSLRFQANYTGWETDLYRYDAFGNRVYRIGESYPTEFQYGGGFGYQTEPVEAWPGDRIGLELTYVQQRWYDPAVGRWLTPDPIGLAGGLNLYAYCGHDPVNLVDPTGEAFETAWDIGVVLVDLGTLAYHSWTGAPPEVIAADQGALVVDGIALAVPGAPAGMGLAGRMGVRGAVALAPATARAVVAARGAAAITRPLRAGSAAGRAGIRFCDPSETPRQRYDRELQKAQHEYPNKAGKVEKHHPEPQYLGGPKKQKLEDLDAAYHQKITNKFREKHGYGKAKPDPKRRQQIMDEVYEEFPLPSQLDP
jgi:RHS repeat-associated protein